MAIFVYVQFDLELKLASNSTLSVMIYTDVLDWK